MCIRDSQSAQGQQCQSVRCFKNIVSSFLYIVRRPVRCPECTATAVSVSLVFQVHRHQFSACSPVSRVHSDSSVSQSGVLRTSSSVFCILSGVQSAQRQSCQSVWCFKNIVISYLYTVRCPECTATAVSVSLVFQEHRQQFSVYSPVSSPVSRVHRDSSVSQSGVSRTSSAVFCV